MMKEQNESEINMDGIIPGLSLTTQNPLSREENKKILKKVMEEQKANPQKPLEGKTTMEEIQQFVLDVAGSANENFPVSSKDHLGIPEAYMESLYSMAYNLYSSSKYDEAANIFRLLLMIDHFEYKYYFGLAASLQLLEEYLHAATTYVMAATLDPSNPLPHYHSAECYLKLHDPASAVISLDMAIESCGNQSKYETLKSRCTVTRDRLEAYVKNKLMQKKKERLKKAKKQKHKEG